MRKETVRLWKDRYQAKQGKTQSVCKAKAFTGKKMSVKIKPHKLDSASQTSTSMFKKGSLLRLLESLDQENHRFLMPSWVK